MYRHPTGAEAFDDGSVTEVIRPAAVVPEEAARTILVELSLRDARSGGLWSAQPSSWHRYDRPFPPGWSPDRVDAYPGGGRSRPAPSGSVEPSLPAAAGAGAGSPRPGEPDTTPDDGIPRLIGSIQIAYGTPTKYEITIFRVSVTRFGSEQGWTVQSLCDEALGLGDLSLAECPRAALSTPPKPFRF